MAEPKTSWPELVGKPYEEAVATIRTENPHLDVSKVVPGQPMSRDYRPNRVRIMVDDNAVVTDTPSIG